MIFEAIAIVFGWCGFLLFAAAYAGRRKPYARLLMRLAIIAACAGLLAFVVWGVFRTAYSVTD